MGRSSGYRARKENAEEIAGLRARLGACKGHEWQKAGLIMQEIVGILGHNSGPSSGRIEPRSCSSCGYFGHTRQHCPRAVEKEVAKAKSELKRDREWWLLEQAGREQRKKGSSWQRQGGQASVFDELCMPWRMDSRIGPTPLTPGRDGGEGEWVRVGGTVKRADE